MKKLYSFIIAISVFFIAGCTADVDKIYERLDDLESRLKAVETVLEAYESNLLISEVIEIEDGSGYSITFSDGTTVVINHGKDGENGKDGEDGETLIDKIEISDMGVTFYLTEGTDFFIPMYNSLTITFDAEDLLVMEPGSERDIHYTIESQLDDISVEVLSSNDIDAKVVSADSFTGVINIRAGSELNEYSKVVVFATNGEKMLMRAITFEEAGLEVQNGALKSVPAEGGEITLEFLSNVDIQVYIPENAQDWLSVVPASKALEPCSVSLQVEPNAGYSRAAEVTVSASGTSLSIKYSIEQEGEKEIDIDPESVPDDEIWYVTMNKNKIDFVGTEFDANIVSHTYTGGKWVVKFDAPVTTINSPSFSNINDVIIGLYLPSSVKVINSIDGPFELEELHVPKSLEVLNVREAAVRWNGSKIKKFTGYNISEDGYCIIFDNTLMMFAPCDIEEYTIPEGISIVGEASFGHNQSLKKIIIPEGVTSVQWDAFSNTLIEEVYLPESLQEVGPYAFAINEKLKKFHGPSRYVSNDGMCMYVEDYLGQRWLVAFASGAGLQSYTIPDGIMGLENYSFYYAEELTELTIPGSVTTIASAHVFEGSYNIERLNGPNVLGDGRSYVFDNRLFYVADKGIVEYTVPDDIEFLGYQAFAMKQNLESVVVTDNVISVDSYGYLFNDSPNLKTVTISARMKNLGWDPFNGSPKLESVYLRAPIPPSVYHNSAESIPTAFENLTIYVPEESLDAYMSSSYWEPYQGCLEGYDYGDMSEFYPKYYTSTDFSSDGIVEALQTATVGNGIDIVLMGDAYSDRLIADGTYRSVMMNTMEQFFSEEPYKSYRDYFNVYMVNVVSLNEVYELDSRTALNTWFGDGTAVGGDDQAAFNYALKAISADRMDEALIVVMMNRDYYAGTCWMYYPESGDYGNGVSVAYFPTSSDAATLRGLILHEAGGHGFAKLADEYAYEEYGQIPSEEITNCQNLWNFGWFTNVDFTSDLSLVNWAEFIADERYQYDGLGAFEGGFTYWTGVWRPTENSIMRYNEGCFNAPSREAIYIRINKLAYGADWQYDYEDFVTYDAVNRRTQPTAAPSYVRRRLEPTAPPVIVRKTWREAMDENRNR